MRYRGHTNNRSEAAGADKPGRLDGFQEPGDGFASPIMTAATPPMKSESGYSNTRHDTESGETSPASPTGRKQIKQRPRRSLQAAL
jgi:hypothetical protein